MTGELRIEGEVENAQSFAAGELVRLPGQVPDVGALVPGRHGRGVLVQVLLDLAAPRAAATHVTLQTADGAFSASLPLAAVREGIVVYQRDGQPLPPAEGGPLRFLLPQAAACRTAEVDRCANVKHLAVLRLGKGPGRDTRPTTRAEHRRLHGGEAHH